MIFVNGKSQYEEDINKRYRSSACGPVTVGVIMNYWFNNHFPYHINDLYKLLQTTPIGLFRCMMVLNLRRLLGNDWTVNASNRIDDVTNELRKGHPVAAKFDKYFNLRFFSKPLYAYHWVVLIGYEIKDGELYLFFHDNGAPGRNSRISRISFSRHSSVLGFVLISPHKKPL